MKHERFSELLVLSFYGELSSEENTLLTDHLLECPTCRKDRAELKELHSTLLEEDTELSEHLLWQARDELFRKLRRDARALGNRRTWRDWLSSFRIAWPTVGKAFATLSVGLLIGYFAFAPDVEAEVDPFTTEDLRITNLLVGEKNGAVQFSFEAARSFQLEGSIDDPKIQRFLAYALVNEQNAGTRLRAVNTIRSQVPTDMDRHVLGALLIALRRDENPAVRQQALNAIQKYAFNDEIRDALVYVLMHDQNAKLRIEAINALERAHLTGQPLEQDVLGALQQKLESDENKYIRLRAKAVLEEIEPQFF